MSTDSLTPEEQLKIIQYAVSASSKLLSYMPDAKSPIDIVGMHRNSGDHFGRVKGINKGDPCLQFPRVQTPSFLLTGESSSTGWYCELKLTTDGGWLLWIRQALSKDDSIFYCHHFLPLDGRQLQRLLEQNEGLAADIISRLNEMVQLSTSRLRNLVRQHEVVEGALADYASQLEPEATPPLAA